MKKLFLTLTAAVALTFAAKAQTEKGNLFLGGSVGYEYQKFNGSDHSTQGFSVIPNIGYFINDNFAIGTGVGYSYGQSYTDDVKNQVQGFHVAPFARLYKGGNDTFKFFGQLSVPMAWGSMKLDGEKVATTADYGVQLSPGVAFFPHKNVGIELSVQGLYYGHNQIKVEDTGAKTNSNSFGLASDFFAPQLGVQFYF